ncbi:hypothetical protein PFICI_05491 [Pestalotiopsis fici W106-1]|uniref:AB hydrolase-1 domain-containing protein n=1 Tax=Pestalotiopsis fici (strain W106-1 / CGMCC3.15140) TaxID=1229662 RepID=W3XC39_PESFW|nr:uncharacterized protein PFICI_05491 [Pestalotiopsis fici W106-1]ETS83615.1 hypothetical protein PFICI_05491 [Pestalotiopsis fici W106-1]
MAYEKVSFRTLDGLTLRGHLYLAKGGQLGPAVILLPGFSFIKEILVPKVAEHFQTAGITALSFDPRSLGESDGSPRRDIDPSRHVADLHDALTYLQTLSEVGADRIGFWGFSFNGVVALNAAALDKRARCVIAVSPLTDLSYPEDGLREMLAAAMEDRAAQLAGKAPRYVPVVQKDGNCPFGWGAGTSLIEYGVAERSAAMFENYCNEMSVQSHYRISTWRPYDLIPLVAPTPAMIVTAELDYMSPPEKQKALFNRLTGPKEYQSVPEKGHMDLLGGKGFENIMAKQVDFLIRHLAKQSKMKAAL